MRGLSNLGLIAITLSRARPLQGRLWPGRRVVPAVQGQGHQRQGRRLLRDQPRHAEALRGSRLRQGTRHPDLSAQPHDAA